MPDIPAAPNVRDRIVRHGHEAPDQLLANPWNFRRHNGAQFDVIRGSLSELGWIKTVIVNLTTGHVLDGHARIEEALRQGLTSIPITYVELTEDEEKIALAVLDPSSEMAYRDDGAVEELLKSISTEDPGIRALMTQMAIEARIDLGNGAAAASDASAPPPDPAAQVAAITRAGDVIELGNHRLICGDCRDPEVVSRLMGGRMINLAFTSPPYAEQREYDTATEFRPIHPNEYVEWFRAVSANVATHLASDGSWFVNIKPCADGLDTSLYVFDLVIAHVREWGWHFATEFSWERNGVPKGVTQRFKNQFEPIYQFARDRWKMRPEAVRHESDNVPRADGKGSGETSWARKQGGPGTNNPDSCLRVIRGSETSEAWRLEYVLRRPGRQHAAGGIHRTRARVPRQPSPDVHLEPRGDGPHRRVPDRPAPILHQRLHRHRGRRLRSVRGIRVDTDRRRDHGTAQFQRGDQPRILRRDRVALGEGHGPLAASSCPNVIEPEQCRKSPAPKTSRPKSSDCKHLSSGSAVRTSARSRRN